MSSAEPSAHASASASSSGAKKRPRHFWEGPDPTDEPEEEKQGAAHVSPIARLYRHALESVFGFLKLRDLGVALSVCRSWSAAVRSMGSIKTAVVDRKILPWSIAASPLARHVSRFGCRFSELPGSDLFILSHHLGWLTELSGCVSLPQPSPLLFGPALQTLNLALLGEDADAFNDAIMTISRIPQLTNLTLRVPFVPALSFAPLSSAARLQDLELQDASLGQPIPQHLDQFRMIPRLRRMSVELSNNEQLLYLLRSPHSLQWQEIREVSDVDEVVAAALATLPTLTKLLAINTRSMAFLPALTHLRQLKLSMDEPVHVAADIVIGLSCCPEITNLTLSTDGLTSKHLTQLLPRLPLLSRLELAFCPALESLSFLSECEQLAQSLQSLLIEWCQNAALHSTELKHILALKSLTQLHLKAAFADPLDAFAKHPLTPPSIVLPKLLKFSYD